MTLTNLGSKTSIQNDAREEVRAPAIQALLPQHCAEKGNRELLLVNIRTTLIAKHHMTSRGGALNPRPKLTDQTYCSTQQCHVTFVTLASAALQLPSITMKCCKQFLLPTQKASITHNI